MGGAQLRPQPPTEQEHTEAAESDRQQRPGHGAKAGERERRERSATEGQDAHAGAGLETGKRGHDLAASAPRRIGTDVVHDPSFAPGDRVPARAHRICSTRANYRPRLTLFQGSRGPYGLTEMTKIEMNNLVQDLAVAPLQSDIPAGMTIADYRSAKSAAPSRWERARAVVLGVCAIGAVTEAIISRWRLR